MVCSNIFLGGEKGRGGSVKYKPCSSNANIRTFENPLRSVVSYPCRALGERVETFSWKSFSALCQTGLLCRSFRVSRVGSKPLANPWIV